MGLPSCNEALKFDNANIKARFRRAKALSSLKRWKECQRDLESVLKRDGKNSKAVDLMRLVQRKLGIGTKNKGDSLLSYDPETDVSEADQGDISQYNLLNHAKSNLEDELEAVHKRLRGCDDAHDAVEMLLDEDACRLELGNSFMFISNEDTEDYLKAKTKGLRAEEKALKRQLNDTLEEMTALRAKLKKKFGDHIGLPEIKKNPHVKR